MKWKMFNKIHRRIISENTIIFFTTGDFYLKKINTKENEVGLCCDK
jgi:hypothetical protein